MTHRQVMAILPHRVPMLFVEEVRTLMPMKCIETSFFVDPNMDLFKGHFPNNPILPGVIIIEHMAQTVDIMIMTAQEYAGMTPLLLGVNNVRFVNKIVPRDTIICHAAVIAERKDKQIITCKAEAFVNNKLSASGEISIAMR